MCEISKWIGRLMSVCVVGLWCGRINAADVDAITAAQKKTLGNDWPF
jgi:hypothetical protein